MTRIQHRLSKFDDLDHERLATNQRRHSEPRLRFVLGLDDCPATVHTAHAAPVEMIEIPGRIDQVNQVSTILFCVWVSMIQQKQREQMKKNGLFSSAFVMR